MKGTLVKRGKVFMGSISGKKKENDLLRGCDSCVLYTGLNIISPLIKG